jgi:hypothetical protein
LELDLALRTTRPVTSFGPSQSFIAGVHPNGDLLVRHLPSPPSLPSLDHELYLVDPDTGEQTLFSNSSPRNANNFAFDAEGRLWAAGSDGLFRFESTGGTPTLMHDEPAFLPMQLALVPLDWAPTVPEPGAASLVAMAACAALRLARRHSSPRQ